MNKLPLSKIVADPYQPRQVFEPIAMDLLIKSIQEKGIMVPLIVEESKDKYLVIDGERRFRAATELKLKEVPVEIVEAMSPADRMIMRFHLQDQHSNWTPFDRARAISFFKDEQGLDNQETANLLGIGKGTVRNWVGILRLSKRSQEIAIKRRLPFSYLDRIARLTQLYSEITNDKAENIEGKLMDKMNRRELTNNNDLNLLTRLFFKEEKPANLVAFLNGEQTIKQFLLDSIQGNSVKIDTLCYTARSLTIHLEKALTKEINKHLNQAQVDKFIELKNAITKFIK